MKQTLQQILALQDVNRRIEQFHRDADALSADVRGQQRLLAEKKRRAEQAHQQRLDAARQADATELRIEEAEEEVQRLRTQLNVTRHQDEYDVIRQSILSHQADIQKWEDEGLKALQSVDELTGEQERLAQEAREAEQELRQMEARGATQQQELDRRAAELEREREELRNQINPDVLSAYDRLSGHHHGLPLARVRDRVCLGCYTRITKQTENRLMHGEEIVYCHSCGRMLMLDEAERAGQTADIGQ
ncbi:MAG: hypothetical protein AMK73_09785 [Planctomycetes bacterium SM23_32]|nr:MAG: hypothetical protein AMK73_09785 [Planctomycetes bacterium SM23_32]